MVNTCCVNGCEHNKNRNVSFHRFPRDSLLKQKWINALNRTDFMPSNTNRICSRHFELKDYWRRQNGQLSLKKNSVPSVFDCLNTNNNIITTFPTAAEIFVDMEQFINTSPYVENVSTEIINTSNINDRQITAEKQPQHKQITELIADGRTLGDNFDNEYEELDVSSFFSNFNEDNPTDLLQEIEDNLLQNEHLLDTTTEYSELPPEPINQVANELEDINYENLVQYDDPRLEVIDFNEEELLNQLPDNLISTDYSESTLEDPHSEAYIPPRKKNKFSDFSANDMNNPRKAKTAWKLAERIISKQHLRIKKLKTQNSILTKEMRQLSEAVKPLKEIKSNYTNLADGIPKLLLFKHLGIDSKRDYPEDLRTFAMILNNYSTDAYKYVRSIFGNCLPHPKTLKNW